MADFRISVRELVEHSLLGGDLDLSFEGGVRAAEGSRAHRKLQSARGGGYKPEVFFRRNFDVDGKTVEVSGRADGIEPARRRGSDISGGAPSKENPDSPAGAETASIPREFLDGVTVEEIKTVQDLLRPGLGSSEVHWGQLKFYGLMAALEYGLGRVGLRLTYCRGESGETREFESSATLEELEEFGDLVLAEFVEYAQELRKYRLARDEAAKVAGFPYDSFRPGQRKLSAAVFRTLRGGRQLILQAPTGTGKTMGVLFPAYKAFPDGNFDRIFYLTAKTSGKALAETAVEDMRRSGAKIRSITLTAKEKICPCPGTPCTPDRCERAKGFFDRLRLARASFLSTHCLDRGRVTDLADSHLLCPFELSLHLSTISDVIICDYNYAFDPRVSLRRFFAEGDGRSVLLVDEAHNLVDRAREMFSATLGRASFEELRGHMKARGFSTRAGLSGKLFKAAGRVSKWLAGFAESGLGGKEEPSACGDMGAAVQNPVPSRGIYPEGIRALVEAFTETASAWLVHERDEAVSGPAKDTFFEALAFSRTTELFGSDYAVLTEGYGRGFSMRLFNLDPSRLLSGILASAGPSVFFSATLSPAGFYAASLGLSPEASRVSIPSPFPSSNLSVIVMTSVTTRFAVRDEHYGSVAETISGILEMRPGNALFFFPSYRYMESVVDQIAVPRSYRCARQWQGMTEEERESFIALFEDGSGPVAGFAVMGGAFGEGIDLPGSRLMGVMVVGTGLPRVCPEREAIRTHYDSQGLSGFDYAYFFPGFTRVLQAAGRVIRSEDDRGFAILADQRFSSSACRRLMPAWWKPVSAAGPSGVCRVVSTLQPEVFQIEQP